MLFAVMQHVAALAEGLKISQPIIAGVMVEMSCGQHHFGRKGVPFPIEGSTFGRLIIA